jgi:exopolysaccharide production protein ExoQ
MPPNLAAALTGIFLVALFWWEWRRDSSNSWALWIPVAWLFITGSRFVSQWINLGSPNLDNVADGSTIDAVFFLACNILSILVLAQRRVKLGQVLRDNGWIAAFLIYGLISVAWSDFPFVAFKRWVKVLGHPLVVLVILTDPNPKKALVVVMKRCAYFIVPLSVLFIKYFPEYGRGFDTWTGEGFYSGVGLNKNYLGYLSMVFTLFFLWYYMTIRKEATLTPKDRRNEILLTLGFLSLSVWLLQISSSATSQATAIIGAATMIALGWSFVNKRRIGTYVIVIVLLCTFIEVVFDAYATVLRLLNRDPSLTDRTEVWADVIQLQPNMLVGAGFESFWLGSRLDQMWEKWWWKPNQAHNGYIETYLNGGLVGLFLLLGVLLSTFRKICRQLETDFTMARFRLALFFVVLFYNYTEAAFKGVHFMWTIFFIIAMTAAPALPQRAPRRVNMMMPQAPAKAPPLKAPVHAQRVRL